MKYLDLFGRRKLLLMVVRVRKAFVSYFVCDLTEN